MKARDRIIRSALYLAREYGWRNLKRDVVAREAGCATGSVNHYFRTMDDLRAEVMRIAVERRIPSIVREGLGDFRPHREAAKADSDLKAEIYLGV